MSVPDFFHPKMIEKDSVISVDFTTWDSDGHDVRVNLGASEVPVDPVQRKRVIDLLRSAAWQAVWSAAQMDGPRSLSEAVART